MKKTICIILATAFAATLQAAIPLAWNVETTRAQPAAFDCYRGETLDLRASLFNAGTALDVSGAANLYWQTNGMGEVYWSAPATAASNVLSATWAPTNDVGAANYNCFIGVAGEIYRAAFRLRMLPSPGAVPSELDLPAKSIDFAAVTVLNAPYYTQGEADSALAAAAQSATNYTASTAATLRDSIATKQDSISDLATIREGAALGATALQSYTETDPVWTAEKGGYATTNALAAKADASSVYTKAQMDDALAGKLSTSGGEVTGSISMVNGALDAGDVQTRSLFDFLQPGQSVKSLDAPENSGKALTDADISDSSSALGAALAGKQDTLPYATNAIPYAAISGKPTLAAVATSGSYNDLTDRPTIPVVPTNVSAFVNDAGYLTSYTETDPTVPAWAKAASKPAYTYAEITGKPTFATVATSGSYNDLLDKPTIPVVPTNVSAFTNDAGYLTGYTETDPVWTAEKGGYATTNALAAKADDADVVHLTGDETIQGTKKFTSYPQGAPEAPIVHSWFEADSSGNLVLVNEAGDAGRIVVPRLNGTIALNAGWGHNGNLAALDEYGNPVDSGKSAADFATAGALSAAAQSATNYTDSALGAALAGKQDILPYATNAIPYAAITGKPTFATVATSGSYNDLTDKPSIPSPTAPVASATLAWQSNGSAIVVSVGAAGTLSATLTGWIEGQTQTALITLAAGASISSEVKLVGYGTWPTGGQFLASATRVGNNVYVTPIVLVN